MPLKLLVTCLAVVLLAPSVSAQVRIDDPDDPFSQRPRDRRRFKKRTPRPSVQKAWLGVGLGPEILKGPKGRTQKPGKRVAIRQVFPGSGALAAGLRAGDVVLEIDRVPITSVDQLIGIVRRHAVGDRLVVVFERTGKRQALTVKLGTRPSQQQMVKNAWLNKKLPATFEFSEPLGGAKHTLKEFRGKPLIIEFWATYCGPCKRAAPWLTDLIQRYSSSGLQVVKISNEPPDTVRDHLNRVGHTAADRPLVLIDSNDIVRRKLHLSAMPTFLYVDASGVVRNIGFGARSAAELDRDLQLALNTPKARKSAAPPIP